MDGVGGGGGSGCGSLLITFNKVQIKPILANFF